jgi:hypothetical protein
MGAQIPVIVEKTLVVCGCSKFQVDALGDHLCTCTVHSGVKKAHDWPVDQLADLFRTTHKAKPLVLDLHVAHDRVGSSADPALNGHLRYPNNLDQSLNDTSADKLRKNRADYNFNPTRGVGFMSAIVSTSGHIHSEFIRILFLQAHRETDRFFAASGVMSSQSDRGFFHYRRAAFSSMIKSRVGNILAKASTLRINLKIDGSPIASSLTLTLYTRKLLVF